MVANRVAELAHVWSAPLIACSMSGHSRSPAEITSANHNSRVVQEAATFTVRADRFAYDMLTGLCEGDTASLAHGARGTVGQSSRLLGEENNAVGFDCYCDGIVSRVEASEVSICRDYGIIGPGGNVGRGDRLWIIGVNRAKTAKRSTRNFGFGRRLHNQRTATVNRQHVTALNTGGAHRGAECVLSRKARRICR